MKTIPTFLSVSFVIVAVIPTYATDILMEPKLDTGVRDKGLYTSTKPIPYAYLRSIEDIQKDFSSSKGVFDGTTDFSVPIELQRKAVVIYTDDPEVSPAPHTPFSLHKDDDSHSTSSDWMYPTYPPKQLNIPDRVNSK